MRAETFCLLISAGRAPVEARRFVADLLPVLRSLCAQRGLELLDLSTQGEPPVSACLTLRGPAWALQDQLGQHALIDRCRGGKARKRWFVALQRVDTPPSGSVSVKPEDLELSACRAGGPGGQHVNKTASAVRLLHRPSGLSVLARGERCQHQNRDVAMKRLEQRLREQAQARRGQHQEMLHRAHQHLERGNPVQTWQKDAKGQLKPISGSPHAR